MTTTPEQGTETRPVGRFRYMDQQEVNLDGFSETRPELGLIAFDSPYDPDPELVVADGRVQRMDGVDATDFDLLDQFIATHGLDLDVAAEAMAVDDYEFAQQLVTPAVPRTAILRLTAGMTPAKMARILGKLTPVELTMAVTKMRVRNTPTNQAHVTNQRDDPMLLAADAATAVMFGFRELETTVPVLGDAPSNAVALTIGAATASRGVLTQCAVEEATELALGMRGLTSYAETLSLYGTEQVFLDGDDTPWSKTFLASVYTSRGMKIRVSSGGGAELLMGESERHSSFYLEARCVSIARAMGSQGVQNGGIDGASIVASLPGGVRSLMAENLMVMMRGLESCSGSDSLMSSSHIRRSARTLPILLAGSDYLTSGFGSIQRYDNTFSPSNWNAEDIDDWLVLQRDWGVDGGLKSVTSQDLADTRRRAAEAVHAVYSWLGLVDLDENEIDAVVDAAGSADIHATEPLAVLQAATMIRENNITGLDVVAALAETGFDIEAERVLEMLLARVHGDYLQTAAFFDKDMTVLSGITDPNTYRGPGTGYRPSAERQRELDSIRQQKSVSDLAHAMARPSGRSVVDGQEADRGTDPREVVVGVSAAWGLDIHTTLSGLDVFSSLDEVVAGIEEEGCRARVVRIHSTIDLGLMGSLAAQLSGSGISIALQAKGTALIHRVGLPPLANLELYSVAPLITPELYRQLGINAARHAKGATPTPARLPDSPAAVEAMYHARVVALVAVERSHCKSDAKPTEVEIS
jgi:propanediol dehydratase large subunit